MATFLLITSIILLLLLVASIITNIIVKDLILHNPDKKYVYHNDLYWEIIAVSRHCVVIKNGTITKRIHPLALTTRWYKCCHL